MQPEASPIGIDKLNNLLKKAEIDLDAEQLADLLWLAVQMGKVEEVSLSETQVEQPETVIESNTKAPDYQLTPPPIEPAAKPPAASISLPNSSDKKPQSKISSETIPFKTPAAPALRNSLDLARALRPLMRKVPSQTKTFLDEEETVTQIVEKGIWAPVLKPAPERWLELALVVEESRSTVIWRELIAEFQKLTELQGAFRDVRTWRLKADDDGVIQLFPHLNILGDKPSSRSPKELLDPTGRRLILIISDCISPLWRQGKIHHLLKYWSNINPVALLQLMPEKLWTRTALGAGFPVQLSALLPGLPNAQLIVNGLPVWEEVDTAKSLTLPVVTLEPDYLKQWSRVVAGVGNTRTAGILFELSLIADLSQTSSTAKNELDAHKLATASLSAADLVKRFRTTASPLARRLAGLMAAVPVSLPVVYLIQETLLKDSMQVHVAEVFMSGLLRPVFYEDSPQLPNSKREIVQYEFVEGVRELLIDSTPIPDVENVLEAVSQYIARKAGLSIKNFAALISISSENNGDAATEQEGKTFAKIATQVLRRLGGDYAALAEYLEPSPKVVREPIEEPTILQFPTLQTFEFDVATITFETETETSSKIDLQPFKFEVATIELKETGWLRKKTELIINRRQQQAWEFTQDLGNEVGIEMVAIPGGTFLMGSPDREEGHTDDESPQHQVTLKPFFMGKYPVTQAQWQAVAALPQINRELEPDPSDFKGANRPVESVSWYEAVEFCLRLSQKTEREYCLPSEAQWEYACRAGTETPFHFGETITTDLANYDGNYVYGSGVTGIYREQTTDVGNFGVANNFGLYDMHGNVWEWCADQWHDNYEGAPTDGSSWEEADENDNRYRLLRGGSWINNPVLCRSASRDYGNPGVGRNLNSGFRVICAAAWTL